MSDNMEFKFDKETEELIKECHAVSAEMKKIGKPWHIKSITATRIDGSVVTIEIPPCPVTIKKYGGME